MAAFASDRRAGWVRFFVVLLCALFLFATLGAPAARAEALTVGLFTAAAVLSAATAALGFKLSNSAEGQATLAKMVQDFRVSATAVGLVLVGSKINGLIDGVDYIKMQVKAGKTYLDERVVAWVQQWLGTHGVYDAGNVVWPDYTSGTVISNSFMSPSSVFSVSPNPAIFSSIVDHFSLDLDGRSFATYFAQYDDGRLDVFISVIDSAYTYNSGYVLRYSDTDQISPLPSYIFGADSLSSSYAVWPCTNYSYKSSATGSISFSSTTSYSRLYLIDTKFRYENGKYTYYRFSNFGTFESSSNDTGLSGTDTLGKDVVDLTLDEILGNLKEWAPDWWDAGADSSTNSAVGAKDLPLNMGSDVKTVTGNPALEVDQPLIYTPWFDQTLDNLRNGETAGTVTNTATSAADTADKAEAAQGTVEDAQGVVQSIISWGLDYISPDKGLFSRFPLCIPYDAYLLVTAALGVDAQDLGEIVGQSPGELSAQVDDGVAVQSDFVPVISVKHDWTQDGVTIPVEVTIDLRPYDAIIKMIRTLVSVYVIAELIASEYKRIRGA